MGASGWGYDRWGDDPWGSEDTLPVEESVREQIDGVAFSPGVNIFEINS